MGAGGGGLFPGAKARPGRDADHSPPSTAEVENEELHLLSPPSASVACSGTALSLIPVVRTCCAILNVVSQLISRTINTNNFNIDK
jgi:hypothetical protein